MKWWLGAAGVLAAALVLRLEYVVYALYVFLALLLLSRLAAERWIATVAVERRGSGTSAEIGERATVTVTLRNTGRRRIPWVLVEEALPDDALRGHPPRIRTAFERLWVAALRPGETRVMSYEIEFLMRGYYAFGPLLLETGDLFGLHRRFRVLTEPHCVLVRPRVVPLRGYDLASRRPIGEVRLRHRSYEDPTRIAGVRPYEKGDPLNRVHWRATARTGELHSKVFEPSCVAGATLLLDAHGAGYRGRRRPVLSPELARRLGPAATASLAREFEGPDAAWVELAVTTAASLAHAVYEQGQPVGFVSNGRDAADRVRAETRNREHRHRAGARLTLNEQARNERLQPVSVETRRGADQLLRILDQLARLELTDGLTLVEMLGEVTSRLPRDATVAAILPGVSEESAAALGMLRRGGFAVTAVLVTPEEDVLHDWASPPEWAARLMAEGIPFRQVRDETDLEALCAEHFIR